MSEKGILFTAPMVRAILAGRKSQTRRLVKDQDAISFMAGDQDEPDNPGLGLRWGQLRDDDGRVSKPQWLAYCEDYPEEGAIGLGTAYGQPGDRLWVRETCRAHEQTDGLDGVQYLADMAFRQIDNTAAAADSWVKLNHYGGRRRGANVPCIHMPRWASRITLEVTGVRIERLQDITEADVLAEGIQRWPLGFRVDVSGAPVHECRTFAVARDAYRWLWEEINGAGSWDANPWVWVVEFERVKAKGETP